MPRGTRSHHPCTPMRRAGISRDSLHKRRATGGRKKAWRKKKKYELGRQPANTKLSSNVAVRTVRTRGGNTKFRALRLDHGNYSWGSEVREAGARECGWAGVATAGGRAAVVAAAARRRCLLQGLCVRGLCGICSRFLTKLRPSRSSRRGPTACTAVAAPSHTACTSPPLAH